MEKEMKKGMVSVITPTYNRESFLPIAVKSVLSQSFLNWELLIIDDGSTDNTRKIVRDYELDSRIRYFYQENSGQAAARNVGLGHANGEYICFLDSDNAWVRDKLKIQIALFAEIANIDVVYGDIEIIDRDGKVLSRKNMARFSGHITEHLLQDNCVSFNTAMTKASTLKLIGGMDEAVGVGDDYDLWLRISVSAKFLYVPEIFVQYRVMDDQISSNKEARFDSNMQTIRRFFQSNPDIATKMVCRNTWAYFFVRRGRYRLGKGLWQRSIADFFEALRYRPASVMVWRAIAKWFAHVFRSRN